MIDRSGSWRFLLLGLLAVASAALAVEAAGDEKAERRKGRLRIEAPELINPLLSPALTSWLVGPIANLATEKEIEGYLALTDDDAARAFIDAFWSARDPEPRFERNPLREEFDRRAKAADQAYREGGVRGRRTARGVVFILYGEPSEERFELPDRRRDEPAEVWEYEKDAEAGLDGFRPDRFYRFIRRDGATVLYTGQPSPPRRRDPRRP